MALIITIRVLLRFYFAFPLYSDSVVMSKAVLCSPFALPRWRSESITIVMESAQVTKVSCDYMSQAVPTLKVYHKTHAMCLREDEIEGCSRLLVCRQEFYDVDDAAYLHSVTRDYSVTPTFRVRVTNVLRL